MSTKVVLAEAIFDPAERLAELRAESVGAGAIASFTGIARPLAKTGERVARIRLDHHPRLTLQSMQAIAEAARSRFALKALTIVHRHGEIAAGEPIVFVGAAATHRRAAFDAVDYAMDRLKTEALLWKREDGPDGSRWIEPTEADYSARALGAFMPGIDQTLTFHPLSIAVLTVSDTRTAENDTSGGYLAESLVAAGHALAARRIVPDDLDRIAEQLRQWAANGGVDVILSTGGTGFGPRDVTPEAVQPLLDKRMDGFAALFHAVSRETVGISTLQSRALAGQIGDSFVFCLPGSTGACRDGWDILKFELDSRYRPCSLAGQIPRLRDLCA